MSGTSNAPKVASVGSPSSNYEVTVDLNSVGRDAPLVGAMLSLTNNLGPDSCELAIGTVTEVTTRNRWHEDPNLRATMVDGAIDGMSGNDGDTRQASIRLQAAWRRDGDGPWKASGPSLRNSPATGASVRLVDDGVIAELTAGAEDLHYAGHLGGTDRVRLPLSLPDFSGPMGAWSMGVYGLTGSGKALCLNTPIPTPSGWTTMGELKAGDALFDEEGRVCRVAKAHDVLFGRECYEVVFSDGTSIIADAEHLWQTTSARARRGESLERSGRHKRQPLLPDEVRAKLRKIAASSAAGDVVTMSEIEALTGLARSSSILAAARKAVGVAGELIPVFEYRFTGKPAPRKRALQTWEAQAVLGELATALAGRRGRGPDVQRLRAAQSEHAFGSRLTVPDIARILNRPTQNAALRNLVKSLPVQSRREVVAVHASTPDRAIAHAGAPVATYPKAAILNFIADYCEQLRGDQRHVWREPAVAIRTTREILETLRTPSGTVNHSIRVAQALELPDAPLPIDPYVLGVWLGDGYSTEGAFCGIDREIVDEIVARGHQVLPHRKRQRGTYPDFREWRVLGLKALLRSEGLLSAPDRQGETKFIPAAYLRASIAQRRDLLAGLLDTDGTVSPNGTVHFDNTNERLAREVLELARSLGYRATMTSKTAMLNGKDCGPTHRVAWTTADAVFRLPRKLAALAERTARHNPAKVSQRYIVDVRPVTSVPVRCITVDSPNRLYLAGESMIPTHNTQQTAYLLAGQMRHRDHGVIIIDPQGQWAAEEGMAFSVQGFAAELGRPVRVRRISEHLRLGRDAHLFTALLGKTRFLAEITKMSAETQELVLDEMVKIVRDTDGWEDMDSRALMRDLLTTMVDPNAKYLSRIYADETRQERLRDAIDDILSDAKRMGEVLRLFAAIHNLFQATNPIGGTRHSLWAEITAVFDKPAGSAAPLLILDMSSKAPAGMSDDAAMAAAEAYETLENDNVKAAILRNLFATMKRAAEDQFRNGKNLNTLVVLDEAWRYAPNPQGTDEPEIAALSKELAGYARDTRKFGIGWLYISQSTRSVNAAIWEQMTVRIFGFGLSGADLDKVGEIVDDRSSLRLYRAFGNPRSTGRYPFLLTGPVSPLSANATPVVLNVYTDFQDFRDDNVAWIKAARDQLGQPLASGAPVAPKGSGAAPLPRVSSAARKAARNPVKAIVETNAAVTANLATNGVGDAAGFGDPLGSLDDESLPF